MKEYRRLKSIDGSGTIMRYYNLKDDVAYTNCFYGITGNEAEKIEGSGASYDLIGFSHGGNALVEGKLLLDINPAIVYMGILEEGETGPDIGDLVNGYQRVIDTHYDGTEGYTGDPEWGIETLDNPYYLFVIEQPAATNTASLTDDDCGTLTPYQKKTEV